MYEVGYLYYEDETGRNLYIQRAKGERPRMLCITNLLKLLKPIFKDGMSILDVGCGVGHYYTALKELATEGYEYLYYCGIDKDPEMIRAASGLRTEPLNYRFSTGDVYNLDLDDKTFDIVICYNLLLHLEDPHKALRELIRVSKKYVIIRTLIGSQPEKIIDGYIYKEMSRADFLISDEYTVSFKNDLVDLDSINIQEGDERGVDYNTFPQNYEMILIAI